MSKSMLLALIIFVSSTALYFISALTTNHQQTPPFAFFHDLAEAFLQGRVFLIDPPVTHDLTFVDGKWYVPFLPLPALLLLPWVALVGANNVNTVLFSCFVGGLNTALVFLIVQALSQRGWSILSIRSNLGLTLLFGFGSVHWYMTIQGSVWYLSQVCTTLFMLLSLFVAIRYRISWLAGLALGIALFGRPNVLLMYPLLLGIQLQHEHEHRSASNIQAMAKWILLSLLPIAVCIGMILGYNHLRFQNIADFGYLNQGVAEELQADLLTYGQFNIYYLPHNLWAMLLAGPQWHADRHIFLPDADGMSLFLTTPALVYLAGCFRRSYLVMAAWFAFALLLIPLVTYYNTGWMQFGYRFSLDFMPVVMLLFACAARQQLHKTFWVLILIGVLVNAWGAWWFLNPAFL